MPEAEIIREGIHLAAISNRVWDDSFDWPTFDGTGETATSERGTEAVAPRSRRPVIVIADTSGIIAASDRKAPESAACRNVMRDAGTVVVSPLVLAEVDHVAKTRFGSVARTAIIDFVLGQAERLRFHLPETSLQILNTARLVRGRYAALDLDVTDMTGSGYFPTIYSCRQLAEAFR